VKNLILILFIVIFQSCNSNDCPLCFSPPQSFLFEIVGKTSGENIFTNGSYKSENIEITDKLNNKSVKFTFISENNMNLIQIGSIGWETEIVDLKIGISDKQIFDFYVDVERKMGDCCSYSEYNEIRIVASEYELDSQKGIYTILME
jgi:hypothetical protein